MFKYRREGERKGEHAGSGRADHGYHQQDRERMSCGGGREDRQMHFAEVIVAMPQPSSPSRTRPPRRFSHLIAVKLIFGSDTLPAGNDEPEREGDKSGHHLDLAIQAMAVARGIDREKVGGFAVGSERGRGSHERERERGGDRRGKEARESEREKGGGKWGRGQEGERKRR